jgi:hypothetical protein
MIPKRIQISHEKGFDLQAHSLSINGLPVVKISRPTKWGNPWRVGRITVDEAVEKYRLWLAGDVRCFWQAGPPPVKELRGKNLACWCGPHERCHGDAILQFLCEPDPYNRETIMG